MTAACVWMQGPSRLDKRPGVHTKCWSMLVDAQCRAQQPASCSCAQEQRSRPSANGGPGRAAVVERGTGEPTSVPPPADNTAERQAPASTSSKPGSREQPAGDPLPAKGVPVFVMLPLDTVGDMAVFRCCKLWWNCSRLTIRCHHLPLLMPRVGLYFRRPPRCPCALCALLSSSARAGGLGGRLPLRHVEVVRACAGIAQGDRRARHGHRCLGDLHFCISCSLL